MLDRLPGDSPAEGAAAEVHVANGMTRQGDGCVGESPTSTVPSPSPQTSSSPNPADDGHFAYRHQHNAANSSHRTTPPRRLNGLVSRSLPTGAATGGSPANSTQPVLVRSYDNKMKFARPSRPKETESSLDEISQDIKYELPPLSAFSFQEILAAIDPEIRGSIDQIAEICGRSRLSLANEYDSHMPPHGGLDRHNAEESVEAMPNMMHHHLEPLEETASSHAHSSAEVQVSADVSTQDTPDLSSEEARSSSWALLGIQSSSEVNATAVTSNPITQSYNVTSHRHSMNRPSEAGQQTSNNTNQTTVPSSESETAVIGSEGMSFQNLLAWLQQSSGTGPATPEHTNETQGGKTAVETLRGVLRS